MKVALVHDYLNEFGGAERVLAVLAEMYPEAPIYTAFCKRGSPAQRRFENKQIIESWAAKLPFFREKLHSPLRFLAPKIWKSFDLSEYEVVISSSSWYMTKGIRVPEKGLHVAYIHTPPRYLYGYDTSINWRKYWPIRVYAGIVNKSLRQYDYESAQKVDILVANSKEVEKRIAKFWRRESRVIYPPVQIKRLEAGSWKLEGGKYYLTGGRLVGPKHFETVIRAANELRVPLKVFGTGSDEARLKQMAGSTVEFLGRVKEVQLGSLYAGARAFVALAEDEDFGITPVEAMMVGTPVVAYRGGGYTESVVEGKTGVFVEDLTVKAVCGGIEKIEDRRWKREEIQQQAEKFSKERFVGEMRVLVDREWEKKRAGVT
jgi:glycosyltransferase involved in cell wall biosynthesis